MTRKRELVLCNNCDEKWAPSHKCKARFFLLISEEDDPDPNTQPANPALTQPSPPDPTLAQISFNALSGTSTPDALRLFGSIHNSRVTVLINGGSTHNFIQLRVAKYLQLPTILTNPLQVTIGNGTSLPCDQLCSHTLISLQGHEFHVDLHVLPISDADIVLGIQWLKHLGPTITDYAALTMQFQYQGHPVLLRADAPTIPSDVSSLQLRHMMPTHYASAFFHISITTISSPHPSPTSPQYPALTYLLQQYIHLFQQPTSLPPPRPITHHIHLLPNTSPVNVRPYRYPHFQKAEIEKQVHEMLSLGLIQLSNNLFSSPVFLVKKKDGSWHFCVDYRALNAMTVKDRFPMPTIDELLDELGFASWFSKLDLRQGFHQISMAAANVAKTAFRTHQGHYEYKVMLFGLCNAPSTFQATMNELLKPFLHRFVTIFFDDILVYNASLEDYVSHLCQVFDCLSHAQFFLKESKCVFAQQHLAFLGHIISARGVAPDPSKIDVMVQWSVPTNTHSLRGFLGLTGFYYKFIKG